MFPFLEDRVVRLPLPIECVINFEDENVDDADDDKLLDLLNFPDAGGPGTIDDKLPGPAPVDVPPPLLLFKFKIYIILPFGG